ncbi:MAG TPA: dTDP-4-dehydrorhamnose 3,5-epimerase [Xanthomonadales bacterium]|nr:dTDP-4-dehydrorhamnose 3,5-epimerase [Xanthomonadales bacterium]
MQHFETGISGLIIVEPDVYGDRRGFFMESWNAQRYKKLGLPEDFVQSNVSRSTAGVIRGLHYQYPNPQGKLVQVLEGRIFDVAVDIRTNSPTFCEWVGVELSADNHRQLYVPEGFAHGFCVLGDQPAMMSYLCTRVFSSEDDAAIAWNDPDIGIKWPVQPQSLSIKDSAAPRISDIEQAKLPVVEEERGMQT